MLDANTTAQLASYLERLQQPIELVASLDDSPGADAQARLSNRVTSLAASGQS